MRSRCLAAFALSLVAAPLTAQVTVTPFVGTMIPMRSMLLDTAGSSGFRMQAQRIYGATFSKAMSPSMNLSLAVGAGNGDFEIVSTEAIALKTSVYFADVRADMRIAGNDDARLGVVAGAGWTQYTSGLFDAAHEGDEDTQLSGTPTGMIGLSLKAKLGTRITLAVDALDRIHEQGVDASGLTGLTELLQHDVTVSAGLSFPLGS